MVAGVALGVDLHWLRLPEALLILVITTAAYVGVGLVGAALVIAVRTNAAIPQAVLLASTVLGGVYFPTSVLPPAIAPIAEWLPLTPGLRALRQTLLLGYPIGSVSGDLMRATGLALVAAVIGVLLLRWAFGYARRAGSLSQY
jgi:ABC-2 type transport system permease protein